MHLQKWNKNLTLPAKFLDTKIFRGFSDLTKFVIYTMFLVSGTSLGYINWHRHSVPFNALAGGQTYVNVLAGEGRHDYADASVLQFSFGSVIDNSKAVGFAQNTHTYCVAPILEPETSEQGATNADSVFSFWAAGMDCCLPRGEFWCSAEHNLNLFDSKTSAREFWTSRGAATKRGFYAVRGSVDESQELGLRQAVRQAVAAYGIGSPDWDEVKFVWPTKVRVRVEVEVVLGMKALFGLGCWGGV